MTTALRTTAKSPDATVGNELRIIPEELATSFQGFPRRVYEIF